jgi:hypothetical protein
VKFTRYGIQSYNLGQLLIIDQTRIEVYNAYEKTRNIHAIWKKKLIRISISSQAYCSDMALISHLFIDFDDSMTM